MLVSVLEVGGDVSPLSSIFDIGKDWEAWEFQPEIFELGATSWVKNQHGQSDCTEEGAVRNEGGG